NAGTVEDGAHVVGMDAGDVEADSAASRIEVAGPVHVDAVRLLEQREQVPGQLPLVSVNALAADAVEIVAGRRQAGRGADVRRARLELVRHSAPGGALERDAQDHAAAAEEGRHPLEQLGAG